MMTCSKKTKSINAQDTHEEMEEDLEVSLRKKTWLLSKRNFKFS